MSDSGPVRRAIAATATTIALGVGVAVFYSAMTNFTGPVLLCFATAEVALANVRATPRLSAATLYWSAAVIVGGPMFRDLFYAARVVGIGALGIVLIVALLASAPDSADHRVPHAVVRCEGGKADTAAVRAALERFNAASDNGWCWTVDALAAFLLHELCGIALLDCRYPPTGDAAGTASPPGGRKR